jgi:hypothetical protein
MGMDPHRPDILLEVDIMEDLGRPPIPSADGQPGTFETAQAMFENAPILNHGGQKGINLYLDTGGSVDFEETLSMNRGDGNFYDLKKDGFDHVSRDKIFHYAIWGNRSDGQHTGESDGERWGQVPGDDFYVAISDLDEEKYYTLRSQVEILVHELGHNLRQRHGGDLGGARKANHWSVMSYTWTFRSTDSDSSRLKEPTCAPIYWADSEATESSGTAPSEVNVIVDYSHGMGADIDEHNLDEAKGVCGVPIDWNHNREIDEKPVHGDADGDGDHGSEMSDFANWRALDYGGPESGGLWKGWYADDR